ncbi:MAG: TrkH family potassium uptake protein [Rhodobacterales bacterium]|nr:TrkH family potassium uptake protein [Rhodobacterales bacterium]
MMDARPVLHILGLLLVALAALMLVPATVDAVLANGNAGAFAISAILTAMFGGLTAIATANSLGASLSVRQAFLLTVGIWALLPAFGALPLAFGAPGLGLTDAYFEAVSGITTTGATVIVGLDGMPAGTNLWRGMLQWIGGLGIAFIAMIFLPVMRVGGMQFFRTEGFDTFGKILPRAPDIARSLMGVYAGLTVICALVYAGLGMVPLDAAVHAMASIATGGFSPRDASFNTYRGPGEYAGALFMILGALPFVRYVQLVNGQTGPIWRDAQVRAFLRWLAYAVAAVTLWRLATSTQSVEGAFRESLFNLVSIMTSTGFFSGGFGSWDGFPMVVALVIGIVGACSGSSAAGLSVFRVQIALLALAAALRAVTQPNRVAPLRYEGRAIEPDALDAVIMYIYGFVFSMGVLTVAMTLTGVDLTSALFGVWTSLANIGYGYGPMVAATGTFIEFPTAAKWLMILAMLMGRLALLSVFVLVLPRFWRP